MSFSVVKDWICDFLHTPCTTPSRYILLKPFYNTVCFIHKAFCNVSGNGTSNNIHKINFVEPKFDGIKSKCNLTHHFTDVLGKICNSSCNITTSQVEVPFKNQTNDNSCKITDYFNIWLNETSNRVLTEVSCRPLISERNCYLDWCDICDFANFWWSELYRKWCYLADCIYKQKMQINSKTGAVVIEKGEARFEKWIRNWIFQNLGIQWPKNVSFFQFVVFFCIIGGVGLFILLLARKMFMKPKTKPPPLKLEDIDAKFVQMLLDVLEKNKSDYEDLKKKLEENNLESSTTIQNLKKQNSDFQREVNKLVAEHSTEHLETQNQANKLEQKCKDYENKIHLLNQQVHDLQIKNYLTENKKINKSEVAGPVYQTENIKLQGEDEKKTEEFNKQAYQDSSRDTSNWLQTAAEVCIEPRDAKEAKTSNQEDSHVVESLKTIEAIFKDVQELRKKIEDFSGSEKDKTFLHLNELLIRNTLTLDNIESNGHFVIRKKRKGVLEYIQNCTSILESKVIP